MNVNLTVDIVDQDKYLFKVEFFNNTITNQLLPVTELNNSGDWLGMQIFKYGKQLEPIEVKQFNLIDSTKDDQIIKPNESFTVEFNAYICKIQKKYWGLKFENATFNVERAVDYQAYFHWKKFKSNVISLNF